MSLHSTLDDARAFSSVAPRAQNVRRRKRRGVPTVLLKLRRAARRQALIVSGALVLGAIAASVQTFIDPNAWAPIIIGWLSAGLIAGLIVGAGREILRDSVDFDMLRDRLRFAVLGGAPELDAAALRQLDPDSRSPLGMLAFQPASPFATAFRDLQDALPNQSAASFIASAPGEGATTAALCVALSATQQGRQVVLVDCDLRQRGLTKALGLSPKTGVLEACEDPQDWRAFVVEEFETGLYVIPAARPRTPWRSLVDAQGLPALIEQLRGEFDLVVLDCPPALATAEGALIARMADKNVIVAAWDQTPFSAVTNTLKALRARSRPGDIGVYVNRVPEDYSPRP